MKNMDNLENEVSTPEEETLVEDFKYYIALISAEKRALNLI